jgi:hypothetical protein
MLPEQKICSMPLHEVTVDLIDSWVTQVMALTAIDTVTNLVELGQIDNKP